MLEIQRWKTYTPEMLKAEGLTDREVRAIQQREIGAFRPAFVNGRRVRTREAEQEQEQETFYDRVASFHQSGNM